MNSVSKIWHMIHYTVSVPDQFSSVTQLFMALCEPMDCCMLILPVLHQLPELTQTYLHQDGDAIQPSHPLSSPSPPAFKFSQQQGLFQWVILCTGGQSIGGEASASVVLLMNIQNWFPLGCTGWTSLQSKGLKVFSNTTGQKHQLFGTQLLFWSKSHVHTWLQETPQLWLDECLLAR